MTKRDCAVAIAVWFAAIGLVRPTSAQDAPEGTRQESTKSSSARNTREQAPAEKSKADDNASAYPLDFPEAQGPVELRPAHGMRITIKMTDSSRVVYENICKQAKIMVLFDPDYSPRNITVDMDAVPLRDALKIVAFESRTFWRPITNDAIFVASDSTGKRREFEQQIYKSFYLPDMSTPTELQDVVNSLRTIVEIQRIQQVPSEQTILLRATPEQLALTEKIISELNESRRKTLGQYHLELKISETGEDKRGISRTFTVLVEPHQTATLGVGPPVQVHEISEKEKIYLDQRRNIDCKIRQESEYAVSLRVTVIFPDFSQDDHSAADSVHRNPPEEVKLETDVTVELGKPTVVGSFQDPANQHGFQIEATVTRTKSKE